MKMTFLVENERGNSSYSLGHRINPEQGISLHGQLVVHAKYALRARLHEFAVSRNHGHHAHDATFLNISAGDPIDSL